jgi:hypothetical protein
MSSISHSTAGPLTQVAPSMQLALPNAVRQPIRRSSPLPPSGICSPTLKSNEGAGAVGALDGAGREGSVAEQGGLLVGHHRGDRQLVVEDVAVGDPVVGVVGLQFGEHRDRDAEEVEPLGPPGLIAEVERAVGGGVRHRGGGVPGELLEQDGVGRAEDQFAGVRAAAEFWILQEELRVQRDVGSGEVDAGGANELLGPLVAELLDPRHHPAVLPADQDGHRFAGLAVHDGGVGALVGDGDAVDIQPWSRAWSRTSRRAWTERSTICFGSCSTRVPPGVWTSTL